MQKIKILNKKEIKDILAMLEREWGFKEELDYAFVMTEKSKIYLANKEIFSLDLSNIKVNSIGLYFAEIKNGIRLSIEGSQIVGPKAEKNVVELSDDELKQWISGIDIDKETGIDGFVILKHNNDFVGSGKAKGPIIINFMPKVRRIK